MVLADSINAAAFAQYGAVGLIAALAVSGVWILYKKQTAERDRERESLLQQIADERRRGDRLEEQLQELNRMVQTQTMTALNEATRAVTDAISKLRAAR